MTNDLIPVAWPLAHYLDSRYEIRDAIGRERSAIIRIPAEAGIATAIHGGNSLPETESLSRRILSLPLYPELEKEQVERICSALGFP